MRRRKNVHFSKIDLKWFNMSTSPTFYEQFFVWKCSTQFSFFYSLGLYFFGAKAAHKILVKLIPKHALNSIRFCQTILRVWERSRTTRHGYAEEAGHIHAGSRWTKYRKSWNFKLHQLRVFLRFFDPNFSIIFYEYWHY